MNEYRKFISDLKRDGLKAFEQRGIELSQEQKTKLQNYRFEKMSYQELEDHFNKSKYDAMMSGGFFTFF